jgi:hypothetical protein
VYEKPNAPRSIGGVLDDAIRIYREAGRTTWILALAVSLSALIPSFVWQMQVKSASPGSGRTALTMLPNSPTVWLSFLIAIPVYLIFYNALIANTNWIATGRATSACKAIEVGSRLLPRAFLLSVLVACIVIIGLILLVVPGVYWAGTLQLAFIALVVEDTSVSESMAVSRRLIKGHWWRAATLYSVVIVIALIVNFAVVFITAAVSAFLGAGGTTMLVVSQIVALIPGTLIAPLYPAVYVAMYYDLKLRKEGADLAGRVNALAPQ